MRCFIGLDIPAATKIQIEQWREKALPTFTKPVVPSNYHITLAFLGTIQQSDMERIDASFADFEHSQCDITLNSLGFWSKPRILFLGSTEAHEQLDALARKVASLCRQIHIPVAQKQYIPHVTLVRGIKENPPCAIIDPNFTMSFDRFHLYESVSSKQGVRYVIRRTWVL